MNGTIRIGGKDYDYEVLYKDIPKFLTRWNSIYYLAKREYEKTYDTAYIPDGTENPLIIPNQFYFWIMWKCLVKEKGLFGRTKGPFKSMRAMINRIRKDEFQAIVSLAGADILELRMSEEGREPGNLKEPQSRDTLQQ